MSSILGSKAGKYGRCNQSSNATGQQSSRNAGLLSAPVIVDIDDNASASSFKGAQSNSDQNVHRRKDALSPTATSFSAFKSFLRRAYRKLGLKHGLSTTLIVLYTLFGAAVFVIMEKESDVQRLKQQYDHYEEEKKRFAKWFLANARLIARASNRSKVEEVFEKRLDLYEKNIGFSIQTETDWNFGHAMYFAGTIYSTIGYGDIYCRTVAGRLFTMVYSIIGIPLVLSVLTDLGSLLLKFLFHLTRLYNSCVSYIISRSPLKMHPPLLKLNSIDHGPNQELNTNDHPEYDVVVEGGEYGIEDLQEMERREAEEYEYQLARVPVLTALLATVGWIFLCAALYCMWEDWDYFTSIYFFFISLSTIGLGDEAPKHKNVMVATYALVIIGLALVSMCITVIQRRLEDLYLQLLRMILQEYHKRLRDGEDQMGATMGIMDFWRKNKTAKFLMPMLSTDKKKNVAQKFQDEAKENGFAIPAILRDLDPKTGLPAVLRLAKDKVIEGQAQLREAVSEAIRRASDKAKAKHEPDDDSALRAMYSVNAEQLPVPLSPLVPAPPDPQDMPQRVPSHEEQAPRLAFYDVDVQTEAPESEDKQGQTEAPSVADKPQQTIPTMTSDAQVQSVETSFREKPPVDDACQTVPTGTDRGTQYSYEESEKEEEVHVGAGALEKLARDGQVSMHRKDTVPMVEVAVQTEKAACKDRLIQTHVFDLADGEVQTEMKDTAEQVKLAATSEKEAQTEMLEFQSQVAAPSSYAWGKAKTNLHDIIRKAMAGMHSTASKSKTPSATSPGESILEPTMVSWEDIEEDSEERDTVPEPTKGKFKNAAKRARENLDWDKVDGLHAETPKRVSDLKEMFETPLQKKGRTGDGRRQGTSDHFKRGD